MRIWQLYRLAYDVRPRQIGLRFTTRHNQMTQTTPSICFMLVTISHVQTLTLDHCLRPQCYSLVTIQYDIQIFNERSKADVLPAAESATRHVIL